LLQTVFFGTTAHWHNALTLLDLPDKV